MTLDTTWEVIVHPDDAKRRVAYRVPESKLAGMLQILVFNRVDDFRVMVEEHPDDV